VKYLPAVTRAEHRGDFLIHVTFSDDSENTIDFRPWLEGPIFEPLKAPDYFARFFIDGGTIGWPNGADIAPETLYDVPGRKAQSTPTRAQGRAHRERAAARDRVSGAKPWASRARRQAGELEQFDRRDGGR
jgi:hypothetical protein